MSTRLKVDVNVITTIVEAYYLIIQRIDTDELCGKKNKPDPLFVTSVKLRALCGEKKGVHFYAI